MWKTRTHVGRCQLQSRLDWKCFVFFFLFPSLAVITPHIATLIAQGMTNRMKRQQIADWMIRKNIDILSLQETYATAENSNWQLQFPKHPIFHAYGTNHSKGVSIILKNMPQLQCKKVLQYSNGRYLSMKVIYPSLTFDLVNLYAPTSSADRKDFYQS